MLYKLDDYWKDEILKAGAVLNDTKKQEDSADFVHVGNDTYIEVEYLLGWIENLDYELENQKEKYKDLEEEIEENYKPIGEDSGWSLVRVYKKHLETMDDFLEKKGLKNEFEEWFKNGRK